MRANLGDLGRVILLGALLALTLGSIALVIAAMTDRKGVAIAVIVIAFLVISGLSELTVVELDTAWSDVLILGSLQTVFSAIAAALFGTEPDANVREADLPTWGYYAWVCFLIVAGSLVVCWRYAPRNAS